MQLQVTSLAPFIQLALVSAPKNSAQSGIKPAIILSDKLLQTPLLSPDQKSAGLTELLHSITSLPSRSVPPAAAALIAAIRNKVVNAQSLTNVHTLKPALHDASLLLAGNLAPEEVETSGNSLKSLLLQLLGTLSENSNSGLRAPPHKSSAEAYALSLYQNIQSAAFDSRSRLTQEVEREILRMFMLQKSHPDVPESLTQRWLFELPVYFYDQIRAISVRIHEERKKRQLNPSAEAHWSARFIFELANCGYVNVKIHVTEIRAHIAIECERSRTAQLCNLRQQTLARNLNNYGLRLSGFDCLQHRRDAIGSAGDAELSQTQALSAPRGAFSTAAYNSGNDLPGKTDAGEKATIRLREFDMSADSKELNS